MTLERDISLLLRVIFSRVAVDARSATTIMLRSDLERLCYRGDSHGTTWDDILIQLNRLVGFNQEYEYQMSMYVLLGTLTYNGQRMLRDNPNLITDAIGNTRVLGTKVLGSYAVLGEYDFVMMVEADNNSTVARLSQELGFRTGLHLETLPVIALGVFTERGPKEAEGQTEAVEGVPEDWRLPQPGP